MLELFSVVRGQDQRRRRVSGGSEGDVGDSEEELGEGEDGREGVGGEEEESCCLVMERVRSGLFSCTLYRSLPFFLYYEHDRMLSMNGREERRKNKTSMIKRRASKTRRDSFTLSFSLDTVEKK